MRLHPAIDSETTRPGLCYKPPLSLSLTLFSDTVPCVRCCPGQPTLYSQNCISRTSQLPDIPSQRYHQLNKIQYSSSCHAGHSDCSETSTRDSDGELSFHWYVSSRSVWCLLLTYQSPHRHSWYAIGHAITCLKWQAEMSLRTVNLTDPVFRGFHHGKKKHEGTRSILIVFASLR